MRQVDIRVADSAMGELELNVVIARFVSLDVNLGELAVRGGHGKPKRLIHSFTFTWS